MASATEGESKKLRAFPQRMRDAQSAKGAGYRLSTRPVHCNSSLKFHSGMLCSWRAVEEESGEAGGPRVPKKMERHRSTAGEHGDEADQVRTGQGNCGPRNASPPLAAQRAECSGLQA